ncbi:SusD-like starch-binding protein associating with outer membrane [Lutibacter oceani]|uniref:SusD-like starch-binding protein associating with outer membrane n=1 Tax=Lutibacter oceani TaxID=1853311 RepID=A0A3D9RTI1_9FLAO|nr:RagB/SusD family nutrient uptake outer membrane protein [Lutibacter oceani]REE80032.1 SusD-like starch-binding protein associating with outer membrane [Lutibacter oceani]
MKTKNIFKLLFFFFGILIFFSACTNELDVTPKDDDEFLSEDFYASTDSYRQALAGIYGNLSLTGTTGPASSNLQGIDAGTSQYGRTLWYLQDLAADEVIWSYENDEGGAVKAIQRNTWSSSNTILLGFFSRAMFSVALTNDFLRQSSEENLASRGHSAISSEIKTYRAEARLLRALAYYHLMDLFGKAAFVTENDPIGVYQGPEYNREQLFTFIESELKAIEGDLVGANQNEYARADKAVAWMILAKMYLNAEVYIGQNKYTECLTYCNKIIGGGFSLASNYSYNFLADNDYNEAGQNEIIFPLVVDSKVTQNWGPTTVIINGEVGSLEGNAVALGVDNGWGGALRVRKQFADKFLNGDVPLTDKRNTLTTEGREVEIIDVGDRDSGYIISKYKNIGVDGSRGGVHFEFVNTDFPLFRLADVYLMYAEAVVRGGSGGTMGEAVVYVNALRNRANSTTITSNDLTLNFLIDERSRELHWEGHRRQDLIRFGLFTGGNYNWAWKGGSPNGIALSSHLDIYPMPANNMAANPNLTQNPGY